MLSSLRLIRISRNSGVVTNSSSFEVKNQKHSVNWPSTALTLRNEHLKYVTNVFSAHRSFHTGATLTSRIKWRYTHKPFFHTKKTAKSEQSPLTASNRAFLDKVLQDTYNDEQLGERYAYVAPPKKQINGDQVAGTKTSPLKTELEPWSRGTWDACGTATTRIGLIGRKIGVVPMWYKNGKPCLATMLHIEDNHVIRYIPAEDFSKTVVAQRLIRPYIMKPTRSISRGSIVVGALSADPTKFTKDYCGLFTESGVMPKKKMVRFPVSSNAVIQPGTPLYASHFQAGQYVDVIARTCRRGFQGVMKRYGFSGMPADYHGVTKSHRRPGCIGSGRDKGRVWPGQKMPGHQGGGMKRLLGLKVLRINHKHNVLYVVGCSVPGEPGEFVKIYDCKMKHKRFEESPNYFPTCYPEQYDEILEKVEEEYDASMYKFDDATISFN